MNLKPLHDWAVIVPSEAEARTAGGLYIPDSAKEKPEEGVVEAVGPGAYEEEKHGKKKDEKKERKFIPTIVKPGDRVLYERYAGQNYTIDNQERILVRERDILGLIERPLQIPAATSPSSLTEIMRRTAPSVPMKKQEKTTVIQATKKAAAKKGVKKKTAKRPVKKKAAKKAVKKKVAKKTVKKAATKKKSAPAKARKSKAKKSGNKR